jgi:hypothetical protein
LLARGCKYLPDRAEVKCRVRNGAERSGGSHVIPFATLSNRSAAGVRLPEGTRICPNMKGAAVAGERIGGSEIIAFDHSFLTPLDLTNQRVTRPAF